MHEAENESREEKKSQSKPDRPNRRQRVPLRVGIPLQERVSRCSFRDVRERRRGRRKKKKFKRNSGPRADCQNRTDEPADTRRAPDVLECRRGSHAGRDYEAVTRPRKKIYGMIVHRRHNVRTPIGEKDRGRRGISSGIPGIPPKSVAYASSPSDGGKKKKVGDGC